MPFKSEAQRRMMHAEHPEIAKRWEKETPPGKLPEKVKKEPSFRAEVKRTAYAIREAKRKR